MFLALATAWACSAHSASAGVVEGVRFGDRPDGTRVVLDLTHPVSHRVFTLKNPDRVVVDLYDTRPPDSAITSTAGRGAVSRVRMAPRGGDDLRVVFDLTAAAVPSTFLVAPKDQQGHRLVIDLKAHSGASSPVKALPAALNQRDIVIAISAGHGGGDPGAIGPKGTYEKNITMQIARRLKSLIDAETGLRSVLVRDGDTRVDHRERMRRARVAKADLFVAIHADAFHDRRAHGASVYVLSDRGASSEAARWLAAKHNAQDLVGGVSLDDKDDVIASVLLDLSQNATLSASLQAGEAVLGELDGVSRLHKRTVQQAGFLVLKSPDIPSILVETAFISNPKEERQLLDPAHQQRVARAIHAGVVNYFAVNSPPGTRFASLRKNKPALVNHTISRGETLGGIAQRYNVPVHVLRSTNGLKSDRIRSGQKLKIPLSTGG
ncbi:MAG: N-acetylmuramoyl-L-alanine amidase [Pseudomonadota bacterium]